MSLQPQAIPPIPEETIYVARAILPKGDVFTCGFYATPVARCGIRRAAYRPEAVAVL
jgi:hypothetical protein